MNGKVILIGAGPCHPDLLTIGGQRELLRAEVVVYDKLVGRDIVAMIPEQAERIFVGKNAGHHPVPQSEINQILLRKAQEGKRVVRLKGGDSFIFGRGGEELEGLKAAGIPYKVIPGISSSMAAATFAGIPTTHRDFCSSVHIITGHKRGDTPLELDYDALVRLDGTLVFMMSLASSPEIMEGLIKAGMPTDMPVAVIENGTSPTQRKLITTTSQLAADLTREKIVSPAVVLVGKVCALDFDWFTRLPLFGKKILVTRPRKHANKLADLLREEGADVTIASSIAVQPVAFTLPNIDCYDTFIFTSANGATSFFDSCYQHGIDARKFADKKFAVIGTGTKNALLQYGILADFVPSVFDGETFGNELLQARFIQNKALIVRGNRTEGNLQRILGTCVTTSDAKTADPPLSSTSKLAPIDFDELIVYHTVDIAETAIIASDYDLVTFTSASAVDSFVACHPNATTLPAICIGRMTEQAAKRHGFCTMVSECATIESLATCIKEYYHD